ncbi:hypothetical protein ColTof4_05159 [Colletotrichum tofieldiae]|uniref:NADAR domain-containing protein n=1 Tax=Colletotrichum tofieldiae TaxID=708197 RepID=A0A166PFH9_9PEZI|nr:hypothetical protein CT0861_00574 [Colletotrichum tofieldiae]GKT63255.1 hypothetical protein ColTof3_10594 [Colletotrichum tofieldiae]GKT72736.1 hypothetical protein ColTof4_05159 [Colletotrichum tofieldiae]GKT89423.1 hypothetical protein Ct61P_07273 [Colletotrichum tofieldiae]
MDTSPIYFWRETGQDGYLSQWWTKDPFTSTSSPASSPITFKTAEHYMMHGKARLFSDADVALSVLKADHPRKVKALGRKVKGFDEALWNANREHIVREGNLLKFRCAPELKKKLLATGERELVEASPLDRIWGIGFSPEKAPASDRSRWGLNLLGKVLMEVRTALREERDKEKDMGEQKKTRAKRRRATSQGEGEQIKEGTSKSRRVGEQEAEATESLG